jgi:hypothetical protein
MKGGVEETSLREGESSAFLKIIHHLIFRTSEAFSKYLEEGSGRVNKDVKFMPDLNFFQTVKLILCDLFGYRVPLT